jgi:hypothetical protein
MATIYNMKGTSHNSFTIGKRGPTVYQGSTNPDNSNGDNGDLYILKDSEVQHLYIKQNNTWKIYQTQNSNLTDISNLVIGSNTFIGSNGSNIISRDATASRTALGLGSAATKDVGTLSGNVPELDAGGKLPVGVIPSRALIDVFYVADIPARDALTAEAGDVAIVQSNSYSYMYDGTNWVLMATTSGVMGIQTVSETPKSGVVSLDAATDIITGILPIVRGGTGFSSYTEGDLLIGNSLDGISKLGIGAANTILTSNGSSASWGSPPATSINFNPSIGNSIASTDVQNAIVEVAAERARIHSSTSNPTATDDSGDNFKVGDIWINTATSRIWFCIDNSLSVAVWSESSSSIIPTGIRWVSVSGSNTQDGSINRPWATIQHAIDTIADNTVCIVYSGSYTENITIDGRTGIKLYGVNANLTGKITVINSTNIHIRDFKVTNNSSECISIGTNAAYTILENVTLDSGAADANALVVTGATGNDTYLKNSSIIGRVSNTQSNGNRLVVSGCFSSAMRFEAAGGITIITDSPQIGYVYHSAGGLVINSVAQIAKNGSGQSIQSVANTGANNYLRVGNSSTLQNDGSYGAISKTGTCKYYFNNVERNISETYTGSREYGQWAEDISANYTSNNYTTNGISIKDHLVGINNKFSDFGTFQQLSDAADYGLSEANKILQINSDGTGVIYGVVLGDIATHNVNEFATASQGSKADTAIQTADLSSVALAAGGKFTNLNDVPGSYTGHALKVVRVKNDETSLEFGVTLATVANTGNYNDLTNKPTLGSVIAYNVGTTEGTVPVLGVGGKLDTSMIPPIAITDVYVVATIAERNALTVQGGDVAKVTGENKTYIYDGTTWIEIQAPDLIQSVNGLTGVVVLNGSNVDADRTATNYTASGLTIKLHLDGIDTKLGTLGSASTKDVGILSGNIPELDSNGKILLSVIPDRALVNIFEVEDITARDELTAQEGDLAKVTGGSTYAKTSTGWLELSAPQLVQSVNGEQGIVMLDASNIDAGRSGTNYTQTNGTIQQHLAAIDTQFGTVSSSLDGKITNPTTTEGDILYRNASNVTRLGIGSTGQVLTASGGIPVWASLPDIPNALNDLTDVTITSVSNRQVLLYSSSEPSGWINSQLSYNDLSNLPTLYSDPLTTNGDLLYRSSGTTTRLAVGTNGQILGVVDGLPAWVSAPSTDKIETISTNTSVRTSEVSSTVTINASNKRVANFASGVNASSGERINVTNDNAAAIIEAANTSGSGNVDLILKAQSGGQVKIQSSGASMLTTEPGSSIVLQPGSVTSGAGSNVDIRGGNTTANSQNGGDIILTPGNGGSGGATGQVKLSDGYTPSTNTSIVTKNWVETRTLDTFSTPTTNISMGGYKVTNAAEPTASGDLATKNYVDTNSGSKFSITTNTGNTTVNLATTDQILVNRLISQSTNIDVYLPAGSSAGIGKWYTIKDGKGNASTYNIIVRANGSELIDGSATHAISMNRESITVAWDGTEWIIV